jgi:hypothetical protein
LKSMGYASDLPAGGRRSAPLGAPRACAQAHPRLRGRI